MAGSASPGQAAITAPAVRSARRPLRFLAILYVREIRDGLFGIVLVLNAGIGIFQETRAKQTLDRLTLLRKLDVKGLPETD